MFYYLLISTVLIGLLLGYLISRRFRILGLLFVFLTLAGGGTALYLYHKPHRNVVAEKPAWEGSSSAFYRLYTANIDSAQQGFNDAVVRLQGQIEQVEAGALLLEGGIYCRMDSTVVLDALQAGQEVQVKGRVVSYDELFAQIKMDQTRLEPLDADL